MRSTVAFAVVPLFDVTVKKLEVQLEMRLQEVEEDVDWFDHSVGLATGSRAAD